MTNRQAYVEELAGEGVDPAYIAAFLAARSNLPGPRANLELAEAFADWAPVALLDSLARAGVPRPAAGGDEFVDFCLALALGERLARAADPSLVGTLRQIASDDRWRVREAVATGLQRVGDRDPPRLRAIVLGWADDENPLVQRAAAAAICEPRLLADDTQAAATALEVCSTTTMKLASRSAESRADPAVRVLRKALGYCWSVAVAATPGSGLVAFRVLEASDDPDVAWIVRENRKKVRWKRVLESEAGGPR